jgi:hypothetical protein
MLRSRLGALVLATVALSPAGCCSIAQVMCGIEAPRAPLEATRDAPEGSLDYLAQAFDRRAITEIYESLHADFVNSHGGFSAAEFAAAYERYEDLFLSDAETLRLAERTPVVLRNGDAWVRVTRGATFAVLVFRNAPRYRIHLKHPDVPWIEGRLADISSSISLEGGVLRVVRPLGLEGYEGIAPGLVKRVELFDDWLLADVPEWSGIRFLERLEEEAR